MKILVTPRSYKNPVNDAARAQLEAFAHEVVAVKPDAPLSEEELIQLLQGCDGYVAGLDQITGRVIRACKGTLKCISRWGVGYDRVDLAAAAECGVVVTNTPGANSHGVAELAFALMFACARNLCDLHGQVCQGGWPNRNGIELSGKKLGIIGLGAIGKHLCRLAQGIGMEVAAYDPWMDTEFALAHGVHVLSLEEILSTCDVVSLHVGLSDATRGMIDADAIARMKDGAILINAARGGLVDEVAVADALRSGKLFGAGFDAFEQEPPKDSPLLGAPNAILLPHTGAHTQQAIENMGLIAVKNLIDELSGRDCGHRVH